MNKYLIVVVVSVLALTGCNNGSKKEEKLLADCYAKSEAIATGEIDFKSHLINKQACQLQLINGNYKNDVSSARTFGFEKDVKKLRAQGFALGGSLENAVVVGDNNILNKEGLRFKDEFVRHKILDFIGDLYLAGCPVQGYFSGKKSGHYLNNLLLRKFLSDKSNFEII